MVAETAPADRMTPAEQFEFLYTTYFDRLVRYATARFGADEAEDLAHEAMVRLLLFLRRGDLGVSNKLWPWLRTVARNVAADRASGRARRLAAEAEAVARGVDVHEDPAEAIEVAREMREVMAEAMDALRSNERQILSMYLDGAPTTLIADLLGQSDNAVRQRLFRARRRLREVYRRLDAETSR